MFIKSSALDGLLRQVFEALLRETETYTAHKGDFKEMFGACLHLTDPRGRLSRTESKGKIYSALGEFLWYLTGDTCLDFIDYYVPNKFQAESDDQVRVRGGYGARLRSWRGLNQLENVIGILGSPDGETTRRAVIQLFDATDIAQRYKSIPCTCTLQFLARGGRLHMFVTMRSNDAYLGLPHDVFAFTMLQELVARSVALELGEYKHCAGSLHLYHADIDHARSYLAEGWQDPAPMPMMPVGDPWQSIEWLQGVETTARLSADPVSLSTPLGVDEYWKDLARILLSLRASRASDVPQLTALKEEMHFAVYKPFLLARIDGVEAKMDTGRAQ